MFGRTGMCLGWPAGVGEESFALGGDGRRGWVEEAEQNQMQLTIVTAQMHPDFPFAASTPRLVYQDSETGGARPNFR